MSSSSADPSKTMSTDKHAHPTPSRQRTLDVTLTTVQNASAGVFGAFMFVHLAAPVAATWGGEDAASSTMFLGRELYQTNIGEKVLVTSAVLHLTASGAKRFLALKRNKWTLPALRSLSWHSLAGFALVPIVLIHSFKHRWNPESLGISPAFLNFGYVVRGLQKQPLLSWLGYGSIVLAGSYHWIAGLRKIMSQGRKRATLYDRPYRLAFAAAVGSVGLGLVRLAMEDRFYPPALLARWDAVL